MSPGDPGGPPRRRAEPGPAADAGSLPRSELLQAPIGITLVADLLAAVLVVAVGVVVAAVGITVGNPAGATVALASAFTYLASASNDNFQNRIAIAGHGARTASASTG